MDDIEGFLDELQTVRKITSVSYAHKIKDGRPGANQMSQDVENLYDIDSDTLYTTVNDPKGKIRIPGQTSICFRENPSHVSVFYIETEDQNEGEVCIELMYDKRFNLLEIEGNLSMTVSKILQKYNFVKSGQY